MCGTLVDLQWYREVWLHWNHKKWQIVPIVNKCSEMCAILVDLQWQRGSVPLKPQKVSDCAHSDQMQWNVCYSSGFAVTEVRSVALKPQNNSDQLQWNVCCYSGFAETERFGCTETTKQCQIVPIVMTCSEMCAILVDLQRQRGLVALKPQNSVRLCP